METFTHHEFKAKVFEVEPFNEAFLIDHIGEHCITHEIYAITPLLWACSIKYYSIVRFLLDNGAAVAQHFNSSISMAINDNDVRLLDLILKYTGEIDLFSEVYSLRIMRNNNIEILVYLHSKGFTFHPSSILYALEYGSIVCVMFLESIGHTMPIENLNDVFYISTLMYDAAKYDNIDIIKYLKYQEVSIWAHSSRTARNACSKNSLKILKYLFSIDKSLLYNLDDYVGVAVNHGNIDILKFLHEQGADISNPSLRDAAYYFEHSEVLFYLNKHHSKVGEVMTFLATPSVLIAVACCSWMAGMGYRYLKT